MTSLVAPEPPGTLAEHRPAGNPAVDETLSLSVDELLVGRALEQPIYDENRILLLAAGSTITSEFKRLLKQRGEGTIRAHASEIHKLRLNITPEEDIRPLTFDGEIANKLDKVIDNGLLDVENNGAAARERFVQHGKKGYNAQRFAEMQEQRQAAGESITVMLKDVLKGRTVSSTTVTKMAADYLTGMADDSDSMLCAALDATQQSDLADHCVKMATLGMALGVELGLNEENCKKICIAGLVHDWGMGAISSELRNSMLILSEHEMFQIRKHPTFTLEMLERMPGIPSVVPVVAYQVHEQPNGRGYPRGRTRDRIHLFARILGVADTYSALTTERPHRPPLTPYAAMECVVKLARNKVLDAEVVRALLKVLTLFPIGSYVALNNGQLGRVIRRNGDNYTQPIIQIVQDAEGRSVSPSDPGSVIDLATSGLLITQGLPTPGRDEIGLTDDILTIPRHVV